MSIRRNTFYNIFGAVVPLGVALITVPAYLDLIGEERFGLLSISWVLLGYFGLFDLGLGRATAQKIGSLRQGTAEDRADVFWTALAINIGFGLLGFLILWPIAHLIFGSYVQMPEDLRSEIEPALIWLACTVPVATVSGVLNGALQGRERFQDLAAVNIIASVLSQGLPLIVAWWLGPNLKWLLPATLLTRLFVLCLLFFQCRKYVPLVKKPTFNLAMAAPLFRYGGWVTVTAIIGPILSVMDRLLIGVVSGVSSVAHYVVPFDLVRRAAVLPNSLASALFPRFADSGNPNNQSDLAARATRTLTAVFTPIIMIGILLVEPFLNWWLSNDFSSRAVEVGHIIAMATWVNALAFIPFARLQAQGRPDLVAKCHLFELLPYLLLLWFSLNAWGVVGAAIAWGVRVLVDTLLLTFLASSLRSLVYLLLPGVLVSSQGLTSMMLPLYDPIRWIVGSGLLVTSLVLGWRLAPSIFKIHPGPSPS